MDFTDGGPRGDEGVKIYRRLWPAALSDRLSRACYEHTLQVVEQLKLAEAFGIVLADVERATPASLRALAGGELTRRDFGVENARKAVLTRHLI